MPKPPCKFKINVKGPDSNGLIVLTADPTFPNCSVHITINGDPAGQHMGTAIGGYNVVQLGHDQITIQKVDTKPTARIVFEVDCVNCGPTQEQYPPIPPIPGAVVPIPVVKPKPKIEDWLKDVTFPKGKPTASDALWNAFEHPSFDGFLDVLGVVGRDQAEAELKRLWGKAIDQTKQDVEQRESDPVMRAAAIDDLNRMNEEMRKRTTFAFKDIFSLGDLTKLTRPIPDDILKVALQKKSPGQKDSDTAVMQGPEPKTIIDSRYHFFDRPRFNLQLGGIDKAVSKGDPHELRLDKIEFDWRIGEVETIEKPVAVGKKLPGPDNPEGEESSAGQHDTIGGGSKLLQKSDLTLKLSANDLVPGTTKNKPYLEARIDYKLQLGNRAVIELGTDDKFGHGIRDLKLTFGLKIDF